MGLFDKKYCDVCGEKIGMLGNKKLEDANLCKNCAKKLSPWFSERRHSTLEEIKGQLAYREENLEAVKNFHTTRTLGKYTKVLLDEDAKKFMVTSAKDLVEANPDVLDYSMVTGCNLDIDEHSSEIYRKVGDKQESYNPKRYEYSYDFYCIINVNHPYFDEMKFKLNSSSVHTGEVRPGTTVTTGTANVRTGSSIADAAINGVMGAMDAISGRPGSISTGITPEYAECVALGEEIKEALMSARQASRDEEAAKNAPKYAVKCPQCGATTVPDDFGRCEYCGGKVQ